MSKVYLVTGANSGLGLAATKQLALLDDTATVYLACRSEEKAKKAMEDLIAENDAITTDKLAFAPFDGSSDKAALAESVESKLTKGVKIDGLIFNAGGLGPDTSGKAMGPNKVLTVMQINLLGHAHYLEILKEKGFLVDKPTVIFAASEVSRGIPVMGLAAPTMPDTSVEYTKILTGDFFTKKFDPMEAYGYAKGVGTLYFAEYAKRNPNIKVLAVSPGMTSGTNGLSHMSTLNKIIFTIAFPLFGLLGLSHSPEVGAKRYVDGVLQAEGYADYPSGTFVASKSNASGPVCDQGEVPNGAMYKDAKKQEAAYQAVQAFM